MTPLHSAVFSGHVEMVKLMIDLKCNINARDSVRMGAEGHE